MNDGRQQTEGIQNSVIPMLLLCNNNNKVIARKQVRFKKKKD